MEVFKELHLKISSAKCQPFCSALKGLTLNFPIPIGDAPKLSVPSTSSFCLKSQFSNVSTEILGLLENVFVICLSLG